MKTRIVAIIALILILGLISTNDENIISRYATKLINPVKQSYNEMIKSILDTKDRYLSQKEAIKKYKSQNDILRKQLLNQIEYINQLRSLYKSMLSLEKMPLDKITLTQTISYTKLNSFSKIILTKPKDINDEAKLYGLLQNNVVGGVAKVQDGQFYGYLISDDKCRFSVFIGKNKAPGIAFGEDYRYLKVSFIPKWYEIKVGDLVTTSGLDGIFFANVPVGLVESISTEDNYKVAKVKYYSNSLSPETFSVIKDTGKRLVYDFNINKVKQSSKNETLSTTTKNTITPQHEGILSSEGGSEDTLLKIYQTQEDSIHPAVESQEEAEEPAQKPKQKSSPLEMF
ncbi:MAG: rod shape-determining protein MreC [Campylobacterales bacterium]|nr:rod shape-determining protein MreC [Campylobacterales bacterium]